MRFLGLEDPGWTIYQEYRVPDPEAPYPQDILIDQNGIVRHWSWEYDPQELIGLIDGMLQVTSVPEVVESPGLDARLRLSAMPNPFRAGTEVRFHLPGESTIRLAVYDVTGRSVRELVNGPFDAGPHTVSWDGMDESGRPVAGGVYFVELVMGETHETRRLVRVR